MTLDLVTPEGAPYRYEVTLMGGGTPGESACRAIVSGEEPAAGAASGAKRSIRRREYAFRRNDHASYLRLFDQLADDFGLRRPVGRENRATPAAITRYEALLTEPLNEHIWYGYGDPAVLRVSTGGVPSYYMTCTSNDAPNAFPILRSADLAHWTHVGFVFPEGRTPAWALSERGVADFWAPELHLVSGEFRVYFVARHVATRELCIGMARADSPEGPFAAGPEPLLRGGAIDPHVLVDGTQAILYWKEDSNAVWPVVLSALLHDFPGLIGDLFRRDADRRTASFTAALLPWLHTLEPMERFLVEQNLIEAVTSHFADFESRISALASGQAGELTQRLHELLSHLKTRMFAQRLNTDGSQVTGEKVKVLENDQPWEGHVVEGIWVLKHDDRYHMFYAGNDFSTSEYAINVAVSRSPWGPYVKSATPFLRSTREWSGPGHPSVAIGPDGRHVLFLHAYRPGAEAYKQFRAFLAIPFVFENVYPRPAA